MRSLWKYKPYFIAKLKNNLYLEASKYNINKNMIEQRVSVYNGKKLESLIIRPYMIDKKLSNFVSSRYSGKNIHIKKKKRKKK